MNQDDISRYLFYSKEFLELDPEQRLKYVLSLFVAEQEDAELLQARGFRFEPPAKWQGQQTYDALVIAMQCAKAKLARQKEGAGGVEGVCSNAGECPVEEFKKSPRELSFAEYSSMNCSGNDREACMAFCKHCSSLYLLTMRTINSLRVSVKQ
ncbi:MAG TPA: hypothetical protein GXZ61_00190 [Clostridiales bacterium]|nr:hypothetical protein [Clostridiales bacterium]